ncbi:unnamed protein product [Trifolium pratense]|uniref:Uncharacterized protein n=1 Tax=Trifolium pratense TaxID=57577 RepID=A0ACB0JN86_TRIPR|nr:unnamed protein product [Trifolium pratense]
MSSTPSQQESSDESSTLFTVILKDNPIRQISLNNIVILTGQSTYETWAIMMITLWRTMGLYELVVDGIKPILNAGKEEIKAYTVLRNSAIGTFLQVVHADILKVLLEKSDPHLMWTYLVTEFKRDTAYALVYQLGNLCHLFTAYDATKTLSEFIQLFENEWYKLYRLARDSNEEYRQDFANFLQKDLVKRDFLLGFLSRYKKNIVDNLTTKTDLTFAVVKQRLLDIDYEETTHTALATVQTFIYTKNRLSHSSVSGQTPYEAFYKQKPTINHLQPFGRQCYVHIPKAKRSSGCKLLPRAEKGIFVGYTNVLHQYRIFIPENGRIVVSADVRFPPLKEENDSLIISSTHQQQLNHDTQQTTRLIVMENPTQPIGSPNINADNIYSNDAENTVDHNPNSQLQEITSQNIEISNVDNIAREEQSTHQSNAPIITRSNRQVRPRVLMTRLRGSGGKGLEHKHKFSEQSKQC